MSQHDLDIANQGFPATRADLNLALKALGSSNSGASAPSTTYANQLWYDTANNILKIRNEDNDAWISLLTLDQSADNIEALTINGTLTVAGNVSVDGGTIKLDGNYPTGSGNVALGNTALDDGSLSGANNTAVGSNAMTANTSGAANTTVGSLALDANTTGDFNSAFGVNALSSNTTADGNSAYGYQALYSNSTGASNVAAGVNSLFANTTASNNTAVGYAALTANTTGASNVALGFGAQGSNITGSNNVSLGLNTLRLNTAGNENTAIGTGALDSNTASNNTAVGRSALVLNTTGDLHTAIGSQALANNTTGSKSVAAGINALFSQTTGARNVSVGRDSGYALTTATNNTFLGENSGSTITTGSKNTILGRYNANQGGVDIRTSDNNIVLSDGDGNPRMYIDGSSIVNTTASTTSATYHYRFNNPNGIVGGIQTNGTTTGFITSSDYRLKENVVDMTGATERLKQLNPVRFNFIADADTTVDGFLAHEVQDIVPEAITGTRDEVDADGNAVYQGIDQSKLVPLLVATIQELEARIATLEAE